MSKFCEEDLSLLNWDTKELPGEYAWMGKYMKSATQLRVAIFYFYFISLLGKRVGKRRFYAIYSEVSGNACGFGYFFRILKQILFLKNKYDKAKSESDFDIVYQIKSGTMKQD